MEMRPGTTGHYKLRDHVQPKNKAHWPTPRASEWKGTGPVGSKSHAYRLEKCYLDATVLEAENKKRWPTPRSSRTGGADSHGQMPDDFRLGQLNPDWVCWLMGWPIGWTSLEPMEELLWLDWSVDPADLGEIPRIATGIADRVNRLKAIGNG